MPNHITNIVKIEGKKEAKQACLEAIKGQDEDGKMIIDFEKIIPMPSHIFRGDLSVEQEKQYGKRNCWYDWSIKNWGTKWNAYSQNMLDDNVFSFDTAWSCPEPVLKELSRQWTNLLFFINFADEDIGANCGQFVLYKGEILREYFPIGKKAEKFALNITSRDIRAVKECSNLKIEIIKALNRKV